MDSSDSIQFLSQKKFSRGAAGTAANDAAIVFDRYELQHILNVYGRMVAAGLWRDYAIGFARVTATFDIYRRTSELPLYSITKTPHLARRQGAYAIFGMGGQVLKRGHDLKQVLKFFDRGRFQVVE
jgi:hypothetical protein